MSNKKNKILHEDLEMLVFQMESWRGAVMAQAKLLFCVSLASLVGFYLVDTMNSNSLASLRMLAMVAASTGCIVSWFLYVHIFRYIQKGLKPIEGEKWFQRYSFWDGLSMWIIIALMALFVVFSGVKTALYDLSFSTESVSASSVDASIVSTEDVSVDGASAEGASVEGGSVEGASLEGASLEGGCAEGDGVSSVKPASVKPMDGASASVASASVASASVNASSVEPANGGASIVGAAGKSSKK